MRAEAYRSTNNNATKFLVFLYLLALDFGFGNGMLLQSNLISLYVKEFTSRSLLQRMQAFMHIKFFIFLKYVYICMYAKYFLFLFAGKSQEALTTSQQHKQQQRRQQWRGKWRRWK